MLTGLAAGLKKRVRSSVKGLSSSALRRWRESMRAKSCEKRLVFALRDPNYDRMC